MCTVFGTFNKKKWKLIIAYQQPEIQVNRSQYWHKKSSYLIAVLRSHSNVGWEVLAGIR